MTACHREPVCNFSVMNDIDPRCCRWGLGKMPSHLRKLLSMSCQDISAADGRQQALRMVIF